MFDIQALGIEPEDVERIATRAQALADRIVAFTTKEDEDAALDRMVKEMGVQSGAMTLRIAASMCARAALNWGDRGRTEAHGEPAGARKPDDFDKDAIAAALAAMMLLACRWTGEAREHHTSLATPTVN